MQLALEYLSNWFLVIVYGETQARSQLTWREFGVFTCEVHVAATVHEELIVSTEDTLIMCDHTCGCGSSLRRGQNVSSVAILK